MELASIRKGATPDSAGRANRIDLPYAVDALAGARTADAIFIVDPDCHIVLWDDRAESLTGLLAEEMVGEPCYEVLTGECEDGTSLCSNVYAAMQLAWAGQSTPGFDARVFTRSGGERWVGLSCLVVDTSEGPYLVSLMRDTQAAHETLAMARHLVRLSREEIPAKISAPNQRDIPALTPRQLEVLELLAVGKSAREIGSELYLSQATVRNHIRALLLALGAHSQLEALAKARKARLLDG